MEATISHSPEPSREFHSPRTRSLAFAHVSKRYPGVQALADVTFTAGAGRVHALLGENGAGKSTLLKILAGAVRPDSGRIELDGQPHAFHSTSSALSAGVAVIYQELHLVPELSVAENLFLGHLPQVGGFVRAGALRERARRVLADLGESINPRAKVSSLSIAPRQMVEIAKALCRDARFIAFDEPTSSLSSREVERLFTNIDLLRRQGRVVLYVTHRMEEVYRICDAATVLRDGRHVATFDSLGGVAADTIISSMVGRSITDVYRYAPREIGPTALQVRNLIGPGLSAPANLSVAKGEIVGLFGLVGAGRTEMLRLIYGAQKSRGGEILVGSVARHIAHPSDAIAAGIVLCPEDRKKQGIIPVRSVADNINLGVRRRFSPLGFWISGKAERMHAQQAVTRLGIKTPSLSRAIKFLSGGNQQKVILGRWLGENPAVVLLDEPTRGIDIGAKSEIYFIIQDLASRGAAVLVVSSELPEVLGISDRILVMRQGAIVADIPRAQASSEAVLRLALPISAIAAPTADSAPDDSQRGDPPQADSPAAQSQPIGSLPSDRDSAKTSEQA